MIQFLFALALATMAVVLVWFHIQIAANTRLIRMTSAMLTVWADTWTDPIVKAQLQACLREFRERDPP